MYTLRVCFDLKRGPEASLEPRKLTWSIISFICVAFLKLEHIEDNYIYIMHNYDNSDHTNFFS